MSALGERATKLVAIHAARLTEAITADLPKALEAHARDLADLEIHAFRIRVQTMLMDERDLHPTGDETWRLLDEIAKRLGALPRREAKPPPPPPEARLHRMGQLRRSA